MIASPMSPDPAAATTEPLSVTPPQERDPMLSSSQAGGGDVTGQLGGTCDVRRRDAPAALGRSHDVSGRDDVGGSSAQDDIGDVIDAIRVVEEDVNFFASCADGL